MKRCVVCFIVLIVIGSTLLPVSAAPEVQPRAQADAQEFTIPGLDGEVTVRFDAYGIPQVYATTAHDLVIAQGFLHASDRWWQMDWFRRIGLGRLSEIGGSSLRDYDVYMLTLGVADHAQNDLDAMPPDALALLQAYADGVNAWLAGKEPRDLAVEYVLLNQLRAAGGADPISEVEPWTPLHSAIWLHVLAEGLAANPHQELLRYRVVKQYGVDALPIYLPGYDYSGQPIITAPGGSISLRPSNESDRYGGALLAAPALPPLKGAVSFPAGFGSNNWVVSGSRTASGLPLLANDPHLSIMMPSIWYEIGLHCAPVSANCSYHLSGFGFPGTPLIAIGHNDRIAWGATNVGNDTQDLYWLRLNPDNPAQYWYEGAWVDMEKEVVTIAPWDAAPEQMTIWQTRFGPVVTDLFESDEPVALRSAAADANRNFEGFWRLSQAQNWDDFQTALTLIDLLGQNFVYADVDGNIGYMMTGRVPIRAPGHDGSLPVDGTTGDFDWQGYVDPALNPRLFNPPQGFIVSANNAVVGPRGFPETITADWEAGYRAARIEALIQATPVHTPETFTAMQADTLNAAAVQVIPRLTALDLGEDRLNKAAAWLAEWDAQNRADSSQAALFAAFWREFVTLVFDETSIYWEPFALNALETMWDNPAHPVWFNRDHATSDPADLMALALEAGLDFMESRYGADWSAWRWGDLHVARFQAAPLGQIPDGFDPRLDRFLPLIRATLNREVSVDGGSTSINATSWQVEPDSFDVTYLPSMRMILDLSNWDAAQQIHTTGQSGNPSSPHYADLLPLWASGQYHPAPFSAPAVEANTALVWVLKPG
jgi:penicillin amidase